MHDSAVSSLCTPTDGHVAAGGLYPRCAVVCFDRAVPAAGVGYRLPDGRGRHGRRIRSCRSCIHGTALDQLRRLAAAANAPYLRCSGLLTAHSAPTDVATLLGEFDYMGSGGMKQAASGRADARASAPHLRLLPASESAAPGSREVGVSMLRQPGLPVPILFVACASAQRAAAAARLQPGHRPAEPGRAQGTLGTRTRTRRGGWRRPTTSPPA